MDAIYLNPNLKHTFTKEKKEKKQRDNLIINRL